MLKLSTKPILSNVLFILVIFLGGEINSGFIGDSQSLAGSRKSLNMLHGQPIVMMPHPSAGGGHPVGPGFPPPPPPFMQVCSPIMSNKFLKSVIFSKYVTFYVLNCF